MSTIKSKNVLLTTLSE